MKRAKVAISLRYRDMIHSLVLVFLLLCAISSCAAFCLHGTSTCRSLRLHIVDGALNDHSATPSKEERSALNDVAPMKDSPQVEVNATSAQPITLFKSVPTDLILSSGFLAFARHAGVLEAIEDQEIAIDRIVGTSSGSLAGAFYAAGMSSEQISRELSNQRPIQLVRPTLLPVRGVFSLRALTNHLRTVLPQDFSDLKHPFAAGVYDTKAKEFQLITRGDLPSAVAASCAIPYIFKPVAVDITNSDGSINHLKVSDGGVKDRTGLAAWSRWAAVSPETPRKALIHLVESSRRNKRGIFRRVRQEDQKIVESYTADPQLTDVNHADYFIIRTPRSKASFFSLKDFDAQKQVAYARAMKGFISPEFKNFNK